MKFQPKRFVVEVKRGTNRAAFTSPDVAADRFGSAEAALFGGPTKVEARPVHSGAAKGEEPAGRILRSLVEPPPPAVEDEPPPARRGRKPGSKNKPKLASAEPTSEAEAERPPARRGRKPGSKNKPKPQVPTAPQPASAPVAAAGRQDLIAAMRSYGFADDGTAWTRATPAAAEPDRAVPAPSAPAADGEDAPASARRRSRLRDRSSILKRYVLDIEPRPGQPGAMRARRLARAAP